MSTLDDSNYVCDKITASRWVETLLDDMGIKWIYSRSTYGGLLIPFDNGHAIGISELHKPLWEVYDFSAHCYLRRDHRHPAAVFHLLLSLKEKLGQNYVEEE